MPPALLFFLVKVVCPHARPHDPLDLSFKRGDVRGLYYTGIKASAQDDRPPAPQETYGRGCLGLTCLSVTFTEFRSVPRRAGHRELRDESDIVPALRRLTVTGAGGHGCINSTRMVWDPRESLAMPS